MLADKLIQSGCTASRSRLLTRSSSSIRIRTKDGKRCEPSIELRWAPRRGVHGTPRSFETALLLKWLGSTRGVISQSFFSEVGEEVLGFRGGLRPAPV